MKKKAPPKRKRPGPAGARNRFLSRNRAHRTGRYSYQAWRAGAIIVHQALALACALSSITASTRSLAIKEGISFGRAVYRNSSTNERWPYSAEHLANFLQKAGYGQITYQPLPLRFRMELNRQKQADLGAPINWFEGGLISGFIAASGGRHIHVMEKECSYSGGTSCAFEYHFGTDVQGRVEGIKIIENLAQLLDDSTARRKGQADHTFNTAYIMMLYQPLFARAYKQEIMRVAHFVGIKMGIRSRQRIGASALKASNYIEKTTSLLSFGKASIKTGKRMSAVISFDHMRSRNDFVDIAASLLAGIMVGWGRSPSITKTSANGRYRLTITG